MTLSSHFVGNSTMEGTLALVCRTARELVPPARRAGITIRRVNRFETAGSVDEDVVAIDRVQYDTGEGPCVRSYETGEWELVASTLDDGPYPDFRRAASRRAVLSALSVPMVMSGEVVASLNLYADDEHAFSADHIEAGAILASQAAVVVANARAYWEARLLSENLALAMESRAQIEQAKGIIMGSTGMSADEAFEQLKRQSQHENVKVREIAAEIVRRAQRTRET